VVWMKALTPSVAGGGVEAEAAHKEVVVEAGLADELGPSPVGAVSVVVHVPEAVLGGGEGLAEEGVVGVLGADVGDAPRVAKDFHRG